MPSKLAEFWKSCWNNGPLPEPTEIPPADKYQREFTGPREKWPLSGTQSYLHFKIKTKKTGPTGKKSLSDITVKIIMQYGPNLNWEIEDRSRSASSGFYSTLQQLSHKDTHVLAMHCKEEPISAPKWSIYNRFHQHHVYLTTTRHCPGSQNNFPLVTSILSFLLTVEWVTNVKLSLWPTLFNRSPQAYLKSGRENSEV